MKFATILSLSTTAYGLAFDGPLPTPVKDLVYEALNGWTPKPTNEPQSLPEIFRRQQKNSAVCGYLEGDSDYPVSCTAGSCIFQTSLSWFGCCSGPNPSDCAPVTRCINSASFSKCLEDTSCYNDPLAMACTAASAPNCINMYAKIPEGTMSHWVCGAASATSVPVLASVTKGDAVQTKSADGKKSSAAVGPSAVQNGDVATGRAGGGIIATAKGTAVVTGGAGGGSAATGAATASSVGGQLVMGVVGVVVGVVAACALRGGR